MKMNITLSQFCLGGIFGIVIACSPTKFTPTSISKGGDPTICDSSVTTCTVSPFSVEVTQNFEVGSGKVDILFVSDNSASMSSIQLRLKDRFSGFIQNLDSKKIDYRIAVTTTDLASVNKNRLVALGNGKTYLSNSDTNRTALFYTAIVRQETFACEDLIKTMFNTYGTSFQSNGEYARAYPTTCSSPDTRGIFTSYLAVSENTDSFMRTDANLNIIVISNDEVRQGRFNLSNSDSRYLTLEANDKGETLTAMMQSAYPNKYWDFNSIIVKDSACKDQQTLTNAQGQVISNQSGPAIQGGIGYEYAKVSNSAAKDIDNNPRPRGQILNICENDYASHFSNVATQISSEARMINLKCVPSDAPVVTYSNGTSVPGNLYSWNSGGNKIVFQRGSEGSQVTVKYECYTGPT